MNEKSLTVLEQYEINLKEIIDQSCQRTLIIVT